MLGYGDRCYILVYRKGKLIRKVYCASSLNLMLNVKKVLRYYRTDKYVTLGIKDIKEVE